MIERDKEYYNKKIGELYSIIENQEKIIRDLQEKIILLKASEPMLELTKEYGEKDLYKQALLDIKEYINNLGGRELMRISNLQICDILEIVNKTLGSDKE